MFLIDVLILITGVMLLLGIASSKLSARLGVPVLVLFLLLGMLAGSDGIGGIAFENYTLAHGIGTLALALILFDGGLSTPIEAVQKVWKPSLTLATLGVAITAVITGLAAMWILGASLLQGMLLGSIVSSTDAAAVFSVLRSGGVTLSERLSATLELESGSNDPMAIFLTVGCIEMLSGEVSFGPGLLGLFLSQMLVGALVGLSMGYVAVQVVNRVNLDAAGLYPVLVSAFSLLAFGLAAWMGGSGFLAVYLAGIVIGNSHLVFRRGIRLFHDAVAWLWQIVMFVVLGLLSFPSRLVDVGWQGLAIGAVLILLARPLAVLVSSVPFGFNWRELTLLSWVGLKGAVPITLATFPLMFGTPGAQVYFDVVFFVVVLSALVQGWSLPQVARWLRLDQAAESVAPVTLEISSLRHVDGDIVDYAVDSNSRAVNRLVRELALPDGVVIALIARRDEIIPPHGNTRVAAGDHVIVVLRPDTRPLVNQVFASTPAGRGELPFQFEFPLRGTTTVGELEDFYDITLTADKERTLAGAVRDRLGGHVPVAGATVYFDQVALRVRSVDANGEIEQVGMSILTEQEIIRSKQFARPGNEPKKPGESG